MSLPIYTVDAFTERPFAGNPAAVCLLDREREVHAMGINMVPTFIVGGREVIVGAEDPSILAAAMRPA